MARPLCQARIRNAAGSITELTYASLDLAIRSHDPFQPLRRERLGGPIHLDPTSETYRCA